MIAIRSFIEQIIYLAIVAIVIELILPKGNTKKYVYVILSLFLLLNIVSPVINIIRDIDMQSIYEQVLSKISVSSNRETDSAVAAFSEYKYNKILEDLKAELLEDIENKLNNMNVKLKDADIYINDKYEIEKLEVHINNLDYLEARRDKKILDIILMLEKEYELENNSIVITEEAN